MPRPAYALALRASLDPLCTPCAQSTYDSRNPLMIPLMYRERTPLHPLHFYGLIYALYAVQAGVFTECELCPAGQARPFGSNECEKCTAGDYQPQPGSACESCEYGWIQSTLLAYPLFPWPGLCPAGLWLHSPWLSLSALLSGPAGKYSPFESSFFCTECNLGSFSSQAGSSACTACPIGGFSDQLGSSGLGLGLRIGRRSRRRSTLRCRRRCRLKRRRRLRFDCVPHWRLLR